MKLAEALQERADLNRKIAQLRERLENNAIVQEGEKTPEDPAQLLVELDASIRRLEELMARINKTNTRTLDGEKSITDLIARKDALRVQVDAYRDIISSASQIARRAMRTEIKILSAVDVKALQKKTDELSRELREVDNRIQQLNWMTELQ
ncbi:MAG: DIP1984 family protein [Oscillospiraceae bacterium]|nr:DIP1984 family protein [Oscillospiraceae bacterium]